LVIDSLERVGNDYPGNVGSDPQTDAEKRASIVVGKKLRKNGIQNRGPKLPEAAIHDRTVVQRELKNARVLLETLQDRQNDQASKETAHALLIRLDKGSPREKQRRIEKSQSRNNESWAPSSVRH
jgi:hypothetical protein